MPVLPPNPPGTFTAANNAVTTTPELLISSALQEIGELAAGEPLGADDASWGLQKLQRLIDSFNAQRATIFSHQFLKFSLQANHGPHTIGPGGDFDVPIRPVTIVSCSFILNDGTANPVDLPVAIRDAAWWAANPLKSQTSTVVNSLYYEPSQPLGGLNFWPIATGTNPVRLESWVSLAQAVAINSTLGFPQGYWDAIVLKLAVDLCPSYEREPSPTLAALAQRALATIYANNNKPPHIETNSGMPGTRATGRPDFNWLTGLRE